MLADLRRDLFAHIQTLELGYFERNRAGWLISRLTNDVYALEELVTDGLYSSVQNTLLLFGTAGVLLYLDWRLALATLTVFPLMAIATTLFRVYSARAYRRMRERLADVTATLAEDLAGARVVQSFRRERGNAERLRRDQRQLPAGANYRTVQLNAWYFPFVGLLGSVATAIVLAYGGLLYFDDAITIGTLFAFMLFLANFFDPIQALSQLFNTFLAASAALDKIFDVMDTAPELRDAEGAAAAASDRGRRRAQRRALPLRQGAEVLHGIDLSVAAGQTVALVGHTGAGKSTLVKLLARFYDPSEGTIRIDGHDLRDVQVRSLRRQLGVVPQEGFLFAASIRDNIAFGRPDASFEEVRDGRPRGRGRRVHRGAPRGLRDVGRRARSGALDRPAPADRVRTRAARRSPPADPRRGDLERRHRQRGRDRGGARAPARRPHGFRRRAPALDDPPRRPDRRARARPGDRAGHPRGAHGHARALLRALRRLGRAGGVVGRLEGSSSILRVVRAGSSKGRTAGSGPVNLGSNPSPAASISRL